MEAKSPEDRRSALMQELFKDQPVPPRVSQFLMRSSDVALLFQVSERTVTEWARRGRIEYVTTPGGHRRYPADQVRRLLMGATQRPGRQ